MRAIETYVYRHNMPRCTLVYYRRKPYSLATGHGSDDDICAYRDGTLIYVLVRNLRMPYVGLSVYDLQDKRERPDGLVPQCGDVFLQVDHEQESILGKKWEDYAPTTLVRKLLPYVGDL